VDVLGIPVDALDVSGLLDRVGAAVAEHRRITVAYVNVHVMEAADRDAELSAFLRDADICYADGAGVVLASRILGAPLPGRMTGADWIHDLCRRAAAEGWRLAWIGGQPGVTAAAARVLVERWPGVQFVACEHGYHPWPGPETEALVDRVNAAAPDVVLVGMGTPEQERWLLAHRARLDAPVAWCLGATADFVSGRVDRGPRWLYDRQEWLARLWVEPGRLWRRFLVGNPRFLARVIAARLRAATAHRQP
jgi:N-acetylglucosaminyldiphosphoundecaprenol N-acetyl-beta-D-mannosaminyltransferase